ncbi:MAG: DUF3135 domain-containing protein [Gammaproteobacteria bacterium]
MQDTYASPPFDFDAWAKLFTDNPQAFEKQRTRAIEQLIRQAPPHKQQRLRCLQWKLDQIRHTAPSPLAASLRMNQLLWDSLAGPDGLLERLQQPLEARRRRQAAKVIPFPAGLSQAQD